MPKFQWSGRERERGKEVSGELTAASKPAALATLKAAGILVSALEEVDEGVAQRSLSAVPGRSRGSGWRKALLAVGCVAAALLFTRLQALNVIRCDVERHCTIEHLSLFDDNRFTQSLAGVQSATVETTTTPSYDGTGRQRDAVHHVAVVLHSESANISADPTQISLPASREQIAADVQQFLDHPTSSGYVGWQCEGGQAILIGLLLLGAALSGFAAYRG